MEGNGLSLATASDEVHFFPFKWEIGIFARQTTTARPSVME
jgi:hypothetical protein